MSGTSPQARVRGGITLPTGSEVASYATYLEAQKAVDHLSDEGFPVQLVSIVGTDLRSVERVTGRLTYARVALAGAASGLWFGLFLGLLLTLFVGGGGLNLWLAAVLIGAGSGMLFGVISYALTGGRRDFSSVNAILASRYSVICADAEAGRARQLLAGLEGVRPLQREPGQF
ncbi:general stress protein [Quadrisphaera sp. KR29]|uniref:general stress protein n=1 Tax=Quadrisphaera sp. KR29 TaxID=3461391 RepID=UPI00404519B0